MNIVPKGQIMQGSTATVNFELGYLINIEHKVVTKSLLQPNPVNSQTAFPVKKTDERFSFAQITYSAVATEYVIVL